MKFMFIYAQIMLSTFLTRDFTYESKSFSDRSPVDVYEDLRVLIKTADQIKCCESLKKALVISILCLQKNTLRQCLHYIGWRAFYNRHKNTDRTVNASSKSRWCLEDVMCLRIKFSIRYLFTV